MSNDYTFVYRDIYEAARGQKLDFDAFCEEWLEEACSGPDDALRPHYIRFINDAGWHWFTDELKAYFRKRPDLYRLRSDGSVRVLEQ